MKICSRCGKYLPDNKSCDCLAQELKSKLEFEMKYNNKSKNTKSTSNYDNHKK